MSDWKERFVYRPHPVVVLAIVAAAAFLLWQSGSPAVPTDQAGPRPMEGRVVKVISEKTVPPQLGTRSTRVQDLLVRLDEPSGKEVRITNDLTPLEPGDRLYILPSLFGTPDETFSIVDSKRSGGLLWLAAAFIAVVLAVSGWGKGLRALAGMFVSLAVVFAYVVPAILAGREPIVVGLVAAVAILLATFYSSHGFGRKSVVALIGVAVTLLVVGFVAQFAVGELRFTGFSNEEVVYLNAQSTIAIDFVALLVAGIIIAALGVLDDVAITQASAVDELARTGSRGWSLFRQAMRVGTDHISAVINTLVLAYTGAALPLVILLYISNFPLAFSVGGEPVAEEVVRTLVSSIGLVLAVPLTTAVAVLAVDRWGPGTSDGHAH